MPASSRWPSLFSPWDKNCMMGTMKEQLLGRSGKAWKGQRGGPDANWTQTREIPRWRWKYQTYALKDNPALLK